MLRRGYCRRRDGCEGRVVMGSGFETRELMFDGGGEV